MAAIAAIGTVLSVAQTLFAALESPLVEKVCSVLDYKSELKSLKDTVDTIKNVLLDAADKEELSNEAQEWIKKLKEAVYDADDLLDEFNTLAEQQQLIKGGRVSKKVRSLISRFTHMGIPYKMSREIKKIKKQLDGITSNHKQFGFSIDSQPTRRSREETCSYVFANDVIGRENETKEIIDMLLESDVGRDISFLTIVGIGGLGKTTIAQLVYNHERITKEFPLRLWVCVGDYDQKHFDMRVILGKILESATKHKHEDLTLDVLQGKLRQQLEGKKYLLVLDDLWNEDRNESLKLRDSLMGGGRGSRILVTTRSNKVAAVVGDGHKYELHGLSDDNSWQLFKRKAFEEGQEQSSPDLVEIGNQIVKKCANVPLAIRVVGTLLYRQDRTKWLSFQKIGIADIRRGKNDIMSILKFSYYHLEPELRSCFSYCALFPKDYEIDKEILISLWMAQGFIVPLDQGQSIEDAGEEYFSILLHRCFLLGVRKDDCDEIVSCKIHDLMHDTAQEVAGKEIFIANSSELTLDKDTQHLCLTCGSFRGNMLSKCKIRTYLHTSWKMHIVVDAALGNWMCLRTLDLHNSGIKSLPGTIGKLLHLRYLDLSSNDELKTIPKSITRLHNLQTLKVNGCDSLKELPEDLSKLINLRLLDISYCNSLTHMPTRMDKLTCLAMLSKFVVAEENSSLKPCVGQLEDLKALNNLRGTLEIHICKDYTHVKGSGREGGYLRSKEHLKEVLIMWLSYARERRVDDEEALLEDLLPHCNLRKLTLVRYCGVRMPSWATGNNLATYLPNLAYIEIWHCYRVKYLPSLGKLRFLKSLRLICFPNLEYMENSSSSDATPSLFFPSLETLQLWCLPKLESWWRGEDRQVVDGSNTQAILPSFPSLFELNIQDCPCLTSIPPCSVVEKLVLCDFNKRLAIMNGREQNWVSTSLSPETEKSRFKPSCIDISNVEYLKSFSIEAFRCLSHLEILRDKEVESLSEVEEVFQRCSSTLRSLKFYECIQLRCLSGGLEHLNYLESLEIWDCSNLALGEEEGQGGGDEDGVMPWKSLGHTLRSLKLFNLPKLVNLPKGMQYLTSLHELLIVDCENLEALPPWIRCFTSLQSLEIFYCHEIKSLPHEMHDLTSLSCLVIKDLCCSSSLAERCRKPNGEDWSKIQHIPHVIINDEVYENNENR